MDSVQDFKSKSELKSEGKAGYEFIGLPYLYYIVKYNQKNL
jgi:hypothetical protein